MSTPAPTGSRPAAAPSIQEFRIRVPKNSRKRHNVMRFNANLNVDISKWTNVKMERENNAREYRGYDEEMPKFGAGSEFGRDAREEARRKRFGITARKYKPENQPWILKTDGKTGKKFKGIREGGIGENAAYYVFTHAPDGAIEAFPLNEWYNFQPIQRYKTLTFEEVEDELKRRVKRMNRWSLMERKKKKDNEDEEDPENEEKNEKKDKVKDELALKISENDDWMDDDDDDDSDSDGEGGKKKKKDSDDDNDDKDDDKKKKKKKKPIKKKKKRDSDDEAFEESDDGDEEGRECEYLTDSTDSEDERESKEVKSVAEEDALRKALNSDEDDEDENDEDKKDDDEFEEDEAKDEKDKAKETEKKKDKKKKKKPKKKDVKKNSKDSSLSEASSDSDSDSDSPKDSKEINSKKLISAHNSRSSTPTVVAGCSTDNLKRKGAASPDLTQVKKIKTETPAPAPVQVPTTPISGSNEGITEEAVRRYLMRKPMTTTELLQKFKSKKTGITSDKLVVMMTQILKKINPTRQTLKNKMYLSLKV